MDEKKKSKFLNVYQNLPLSERKNTILVLEENEKGNLKKIPVSWDVAYMEIDQETKIGERILNKLFELELI